MGERYYDYGGFVAGILTWLSAGAVSALLFAPWSSIAGLLCIWHPLHFLAFIFQSKYIPGFVGLLMAGIQFRVGIKNIREAARLRNQGIPHHSRSRGRAIWSNEGLALFYMELFLAFFNWPIAVLFGAGYSMNSMLKAAQDAAIRERYLDKLDQEIENLYLKDTALGNKPPELAFLYHQIDPSINPEVREQMAAALVDEPVTVVAQPPKKGKTYPQPPPQEPVITETSPPSGDPELELGNMSEQKSSSGLAHLILTEEDFFWLVGNVRKFRRFITPVLVILLGVIAVYAALNFFHYHKSASAPVAQKQTPQPAPKPYAQPIPVQSPEPKPRPPAAVPPAVVPMTQPRVEMPTQADLQQQKSQEYAQLVEQFSTLLVAEADKMAQFKNVCEATLANNTNLIAGVAHSHRAELLRANTMIQETLEAFCAGNASGMNNIETQISNIGVDPQIDPHAIMKNLKTKISQNEHDRQTINSALDDLSAKIKGAPAKFRLFN